MVTGFTGYRITAGPFSQKTVRFICNATYSSVTRGKYLINFSREGKKKRGRHRRERKERRENYRGQTYTFDRNTMPKMS
jgi:hypothetical protein